MVWVWSSQQDAIDWRYLPYIYIYNSIYFWPKFQGISPKDMALKIWYVYVPPNDSANLLYTVLTMAQGMAHRWLKIWWTSSWPWAIFWDLQCVFSSGFTKQLARCFQDDLPSGELTFCNGKIHHFLMGKSTISMAMFNCYVSLPEGTQ